MAASAVVYAGLRVWDGVADGYLDGVDAIRVVSGRIAALGGVEDISADAEVRTVSGLTALPGLIDAHVHMVLDPAVRDPLAQPRGNPEKELAAMVERGT
jgi:imidazolonepropionase-like amidohydrolase